MTEVSGLRNTGKPRPLGELKDSHIYFEEAGNEVISHRSQNVTITETRRRTKHNFRRMKEMRENLRQAALINIVAAVNDDYEPSPRASSSSYSDSINNSMAVISNLVLNKDRTISIPKRQDFFDAPQEFSTKKSLFCKSFEADNPQETTVDDSIVEERKRNFVLSRTRTSLVNATTKGVSNGDTPPVPQSFQNTKESKDDAVLQQSNLGVPMKVRSGHGQSRTLRRKLSSLKKSDLRVPSRISKCDAVDITESSEPGNTSTTFVQVTSPMTMIPPKETQKEKSHPSSATFKTYRAKSLPAIFPIKRKKSTLHENSLITASKETKEVTQEVVREVSKEVTREVAKEVKMAAPFKAPTVGVYTNNHVTHPANTEDKARSSSKSGQLSLGSTLGSVRRQDSKLNITFRTPPSENEDMTDPVMVRRLDRAILLEGRPFVSPFRSQPNSAYSYHSKTRERKLNVTAPSLHVPEKERDMVREIDCQFEELQKRISKKISTWSQRRGLQSPSDNSDEHDIAVSGYNMLKNGGMKSSLSSAQSRATTGSMRGHKRVKFVDDESSKYENSVTNIQNWDFSDVSSIRAQGVANKIHETPQKPAARPMSPNEILILKRKLMQGQQFAPQPPQSKFNNNSFRISGMGSRTATRPAGSLNSAHSDRKSTVSDSLTELTGNEGYFYGKDPDVTDRTSTNVAKSYGMSSFYPDNNYNYIYDDCSDIDDDDPLEDDYDYDDRSIDDTTYRMVKAIDLGTLSGFQHRKFRKPDLKETTATHFVKIKVKS